MNKNTKDPSIKRHNNVMVRFTDNEYALVKQNAAHAGNNKLADLNQLSKTVAYEQEHGFNTKGEITKAELAMNTRYRTAQSSMERINDAYNDINEKITFAGRIRDTYAIYQQYRTSKNPQSFYRQYKRQIDQYRQAVRFFKDRGYDRIPSLKALYQEKQERILPQYEKCRQTLTQTATARKELSNMKANINTLLNRDWEKSPVQNIQKQRIHHSSSPSR